ncbi:MAG TPA: AsmA family protein [Terriglobales bacterium]|nr:AsmA family protein [Terriglobales bacterium]
MRRNMLAAGLVLSLMVFVPPLVKLKSFHKDIIEAISGGLGRQVSFHEVRLRVFPRPGFRLEGFVVQDDPAFSSEPMLRADEVSANLRLSSLWRWRPEISSLVLKSPPGKQPWSFNIVRRQDGRWNVQSLLARASQTSTVSTNKNFHRAWFWRAGSQTQPRFPYLEGEGGRINFKAGREKKAYALSEADFSWWMASDSEWNLRLHARPVRTDTNMSDTGVIEATGTAGRSLRLDETPLRLRARFHGAQLGQLTRLVYGRDRGWRGSINVVMDVIGTPKDLKLSASGAIDDFRRYDIITPDAQRLAATCTARYQWQHQELSHIDCHLGDGALTLRGSIANLPGPRQYSLTLVAQGASMAALAHLARHVKFGLPSDLSAAGVLDAEFAYQRGPREPTAAGWAGEGSIRDLVLRSKVFGRELELGSIKFGIAQQQATAQPSRRSNRGSMYPAPFGGDSPTEPRLALAPFSVPLGEAEPALIQASLSATDYTVGMEGDAELQRLFRVARGLGIHAPNMGASGSIRAKLQIAGSWTGFAPPVSTGSLQLRNVTVHLAGVRGPAHVRSAVAVLLPEKVRIEHLVAVFTASHTAVDGSLALSRGCDSPQPCPLQFDLHSSYISLDELDSLLNPRFREVPWYRALAGDAGGSLATLAAQGRLRADHVTLRGLELQRLVAQAELRDRQLRLSDLRAEMLGGKMRAQWNGDFTGDMPVYNGSGTLEGVSLPQVAALTGNLWATGTAGAKFKLEIAGWSAAELAQSARGVLDFEWQNGVLPHLELNGSGAPVRLKRFVGRALLLGRRLEFQQSRIETADGIYSVSGTASLNRLELSLVDRNSHMYAVSGTLEEPHVIVLSSSETQAALGK